MSFVIDTDTYEDHGIELFKFPGGEWHANVPHWPFKVANVHAKIRTWDDFGKLLVVLSALRHQIVAVHLFMPYAPGIRQDRSPGGLTPLTPEIYGGALRGLVQTLTVADPHSKEGLEYFRRAMSNTGVRVIDPETYLSKLLPLDYYDYIVQPDAGALIRTNETARILGLSVQNQVLRCEKHRDFNTGKLSGFKVPEIIRSFDVETRILIPDDVCDGGGTFLGLLDAITELNPDVSVDLFITHGVFSNDALKRLYAGGFEWIYTTDSWYQYNPSYPFVKSIDLLPFYLGGLHP